MLAKRMLQAASVQTGGAGAPAAPSSLTATADGGYARIRLAWTDNSNNETGFKIERSTDGSSYSQITTVPAGREWYVDSGLTRGQIYYYKVRAYNGSGDSAYTSAASATPFALTDLTYRVLLDGDTQVYTDLAGSTPVASDGDLVRRWNNQGTLGGYFDVASDTRRPTWQQAEINSKASLRFATDDALKDGANTASTWKFLHDGSGYSIVVVYKTTSTDPNAAGMILDTCNGAATANVGMSYFYDDRNSVPRLDTMVFAIVKGVAPAHGFAVTGRQGVRSGTWHVSAARYDGALGSANLRADNDGMFGANATATKSGTASSSNPTSYLHIGSTTGSASFFNGDIAFLAITSSALSDADYHKLQEYAAETYDVEELHWFDTETVVQHDASGDDHNGFPALCVAANGDLVMAYTKCSTHTAFDGKLIVRRSQDKGATWGSEQTVFDFDTDGGGTDFWASGGLTTLADGRIMLLVGKRVSGAGVVDGIGYFESSDNGATWGSVNTLNPSLTGFAAEGGGIYELSNGDLLFPFYGQNSTDAGKWSACLLRSTDGGATWGSQVTVAPGITDGKTYAEPGFVEIGSTLYCFFREEGSTEMRITTSTNNGATWGARSAVIGLASGRMTPLKLATGEVITPIRWTNIGTNPCAIAYTKDGSIWQVGNAFAESPNFTDAQMVYGQFAQDAEGNLYLAYAQEASGASVADVMFTKAIR